jgi:hypothetical protein
VARGEAEQLGVEGLLHEVEVAEDGECQRARRELVLLPAKEEVGEQDEEGER